MRSPWSGPLVAAFFVVSTCLLAGCASAPAPQAIAADPPFVIERVDKALSLPQGRVTVHIDNPWGSVNVRGTDTHEIIVHAVVQRIGVDPDRARIELAGDAQDASLNIAFERAARDCARRLPGGERIGRVDLAVFVPRNVAVDVKVGCDGTLSTDLIRGDLAARTESGRITASATGQVDLESASGRIRAYVGLETNASSRVRSAGSIVLTLPAAVRALITAHACGGIRTRELALTRTPGTGGCESGRAVLGEDGAPLAVDSTASWIELRTQAGTRS